MLNDNRKIDYQKFLISVLVSSQSIHRAGTIRYTYSIHYTFKSSVTSSVMTVVGLDDKCCIFSINCQHSSQFVYRQLTDMTTTTVCTANKQPNHAVCELPVYHLHLLCTYCGHVPTTNLTIHWFLQQT